MTLTALMTDPIVEWKQEYFKKIANGEIDPLELQLTFEELKVPTWNGD